MPAAPSNSAAIGIGSCIVNNAGSPSIQSPLSRQVLIVVIDLSAQPSI
jgi:hypothetical protein